MGESEARVSGLFSFLPDPAPEQCQNDQLSASKAPIPGPFLHLPSGSIRPSANRLQVHSLLTHQEIDGQRRSGASGHKVPGKEWYGPAVGDFIVGMRGIHCRPLR